jgi:penicillin-binding protein 2A
MGTKNSSGANPKQRKKKAGKRNAGKAFVWALGLCLFAMFCATAGYLTILFNGQRLFLLNQDKLNMAESAKVYDIENNEIATLYKEGVNREIVEMKDIPDRLKQAFIATEDKRFNEHSGIDLWSIGRALVKDIIHRSAVEGGSTITQQLAKNLFLSSEKTLFRKATEASIALALERNLSKDQILEMYLNRIYFGNRAYGIKAASITYFGQPDLHKLELWQIATLAAIPKAPAYYNPIDHPDRSKERRAVVLALMRDQGYITEEERAAAAAVDYAYEPPEKKSNYAAFIDFAIQEAVTATKISEDELLRGGYSIYTTMDPKAQLALEETYKDDSLFQKDGPKQKMQSAMVIINYRTGGIVGMIGGRDYKSKGLNRAVARRSPGSAFKPIIAYAPALELNYDKWNPYSWLKDEPMSFGNYTPRNWDGIYTGQIRMIDALQKSANVPSVWLLQQISVKKGMEFAKALGIPFDEQDANLALALGGMTKGVTPLEMASAYGAFANNGLLYEPHSVVKVLDADGREVYKAKTEPKRVMSPRTAWNMTVMLKNVVDNGLGKAAKMNRPVAGKTGTTQLDLKGLEKYNRDIWFAGYTPEWSAAVWMGFDNTDREHYVSASSSLPAKLFKEVMTKALEGKPVTAFKKPDGVEEVKEPPKAPSPITDLTAEYNTEGKHVMLSWSPSEGENIVYKTFRKGSKDEQFVELPRTTTPGLKDFPIPGDRYQYYVVPYNSQTNEEGAQSNIVSVEVPAKEDSPQDDLLPVQPGDLPDLLNPGGRSDEGAGENRKKDEENGKARENGENGAKKPREDRDAEKPEDAPNSREVTQQEDSRNPPKNRENRQNQDRKENSRHANETE